MRVSINTLVAAFLSAAILAACGGGNNGLSSPMPTSVTPSLAAPDIGLPQALRSRPPFGQSRSPLVRKKAMTYKVLYSFKGYPADGAYPYASLLDVNSTLYGTTQFGGPGKCKTGSGHRSGCGTVFAITTSGAETVLRSFEGGNGESPLAGLLDINGTLYGTTSQGGKHRSGTVFAITTSGMFRVLHSFEGDGSGDGDFPTAGLINIDGTLYGTTLGGGQAGADGVGTVFSITTSGKERVLYGFAGGSVDGANPYGGLINVNGTLYGTTTQGGNGACFDGCGTVFEIKPSGAETVLYNFAGGPGDGESPETDLINVKGTLYGTTAAGGANCSSSGGCGTVFKISTSGTEKVLHSFGGSDGNEPIAGLINVKGTLYGTTAYGGRGTACGSSACGTVFKITTSGKETVLYSFAGEPDGAVPEAALTKLNDTLYGTTIGGGANNHGTVFSLTP
jgi:uncharacterized repeat protein (TIGR03803 family)